MRFLRRLSAFARAESGIVAVESAFVLPVLIAFFFGGYAVSQAVGISRKVTITTRAMADLVTQYSAMSTTDMTAVMNASSQIIAPYSPTPIQFRLSQITTDATGLLPTVSWSVGQNMTPYVKGAPFVLPLSMLKPNISYIYSEVQYPFTPLVSFGLMSFNINDHIYMMPRQSASVSYSG